MSCGLEIANHDLFPYICIYIAFLQSSDDRTYRLHKGRFWGVRNTIDLCFLLSFFLNPRLRPN